MASGRSYAKPTYRRLKSLRSSAFRFRYERAAVRRESKDQAALTAIFLSAFCASALFGSVTVSTPFEKLKRIPIILKHSLHA